MMSYRNEKYNKDGTIDCEIDHPEFGWIPTTLSGSDPETAELFTEVAANGSPIAYIAPPLSEGEVLQTIEASYQTAINQNIDYMSHSFQADKDSRLILSEVLSAGALPVGFYWLASDNTEVPMSFMELQGLASAMLVRNQSHFAHKQALKQQVALATTEADLLAITWSPPNG